MITGAVCLSHSPLMDHVRARPALEADWTMAVRAAGKFAEESDPDLCLVFFPDHLNGFFYDLLPAFCIGAAGTSIGDFGTVPGQLDIPEEIALDCAADCLAKGFDAALSYDMRIDHGGVQPLELLSGDRLFTRFIPIFINCAAPPRPSFARARAFGRAIGEWAQKRPERILVIGSGGLSHDPPLPALATATDAVRTRLIQGGELSYADRLKRQKRVWNEGFLFPAGQSTLRPLNEDWDRRFLAAVVEGDLTALDGVDDEAITAAAGCGAHELRCWIAALSALGDYRMDQPFYAPVEEWITGMGLVTARRKS